MVSSSDPRNVRQGRSAIIIAFAGVITLLFLPLTASTNNNNNALLQTQSVFAQQQGGEQQESAFLPYVNPIHRIFMEYPSNWIASTSGLADYTELIAFYSPIQNVSDFFPARLTISVINFAQNISLPEYTDSVQTILNQSDQVDVRSSSEVTLSGYPGHRVVVAIQPFQNSTSLFHQMSTWTTVGNKVYLLTYEGEESTFNEYLPEVSQMLESLRLNITAPITGENLVQ
jgi:uncharacterized membrane protein YjfL (UPF0719 family)